MTGNAAVETSSGARPVICDGCHQRLYLGTQHFHYDRPAPKEAKRNVR